MIKACLPFLFLASCATTSPIVLSREPSEVKMEQTMLNKKSLEVSCLGSGISPDHAKRDAILVCKQNASAFLDSSLSIRSRTYETPNNVYQYTEVSNIQAFENLSCEPKTERIIPSDNGYQVMLRCFFDLSVVGKVKHEFNSRSKAMRESVSSPNNDIIKDSNYLVFLKTVPLCEKILILGKNAREYLCSGTVNKLWLKAGDASLVIERKGFLPYELRVVSAKDLDTFTILLEKK